MAHRQNIIGLPCETDNIRLNQHTEYLHTVHRIFWPIQSKLSTLQQKNYGNSERGKSFQCTFAGMEMKRINELKERVMDMFLRYGIKSVSMDDISRELGMSKKTLYQLVTDKKHLVHTALSNIFEKEVDFCGFTQQHSENAIEELLMVKEHVTEIFTKVSPTTMYDLAKYYKEVWTLLESKREKLIQDFFEDNIKRGKKEGLYRTDINEIHIGQIYLALVTAITDRQKNTRTESPDIGLYRTYIDYHIRAIVTSKGLTTYEDYLKHNTRKT